MWAVVVGSAILSLASGVSVHFSDCGSVKGEVTNIDINPCPRQPCFLRRGHNTTVVATFTSHENTGKLTAVVHGIIGGIPIAFPLPNSDGCKGSGVTCPVAKGSTFTYTATLPVYQIYPTIKVVVKWELKDESGNDVFCFVVPVEITD